MSKINDIWNKLFKYWSQHESDFSVCDGAKDEEVKNLETSLGLELPDSLKISLKKCNLYPDKNKVIQNSFCLLTGAAGKLFDIKEINNSYFGLNSHRFFGEEAMDLSSAVLK